MSRLETYLLGLFDGNHEITLTHAITKVTTNLKLNQIIAEVVILIAAAEGPWKTITINGIVFYHIKGNNRVLTTLEQDDKIIGDELGQIIIATYLDGLADPNDLTNPLIWDKNAIG